MTDKQAIDIIPIRESSKMSEYHKQKTNTQKASDLIALASAIISEGPSGAVLSIGKIAQGLVKGRLFQTLKEEIEKKIVVGELKQDFWEKMKNFHSFSELLNFIDSENPDEERFKAAKAMFFFLASIGNDEGQEILAYNLFKISLKLSATQILILKICYQEKDDYSREEGHNDHSTWLRFICGKMGNLPQELLLLEEQGLEENKLLSGRQYTDGSGVSAGNARLSSLGMLFCEKLISG